MSSTTTTTPSVPQLPVEISEKIIDYLWSSPLSPHDRAILIKSSSLVSRTWNAVSTRIFMKDVHILSATHGLQFIDLLLGNAGSGKLQMLDQLCRSITIEHSNKSLLPGPATERDQPLGLVIHSILEDIFLSPNRLPSLRRISLKLENYLMETIFTRNKFYYLAPQVEELEFDFTYSKDTDPMVIQGIKNRCYESFDIRSDKMLHIRKLRVFGTSIGVARELFEACGGSRNLEVFEHNIWGEVEPVVSQSSIKRDRSDREGEEKDVEDENEVFYDCEDAEGQGS